MFHGSGDVRLPFGLYNFLRCTQARGEERALEDKWLSFHWQACLFPPSGRLFHELRFDSRSGPRGVWEAASSDRSLTPPCACRLTERPQRRQGSLNSPLLWRTATEKRPKSTKRIRAGEKSKNGHKFSPQHFITTGAISELRVSLCHTVFPSPNHINCKIFCFSPFSQLPYRSLVNITQPRRPFPSAAALKYMFKGSELFAVTSCSGSL